MIKLLNYFVMWFSGTPLFSGRSPTCMSATSHEQHASLNTLQLCGVNRRRMGRDWADKWKPLAISCISYRGHFNRFDSGQSQETPSPLQEKWLHLQDQRALSCAFRRSAWRKYATLDLTLKDTTPACISLNSPDSTWNTDLALRLASGMWWCLLHHRSVTSNPKGWPLHPSFLQVELLTHDCAIWHRVDHS